MTFDKSILGTPIKNLHPIGTFGRRFIATVLVQFM